VTTKGLADPVAVFVPHVAVKLAAVPPLVEFVKFTVTCVAPAATEVTVGAPGAVTAAVGVTEALLEEAALVPPVLVAVTVQV